MICKGVLEMEHVFHTLQDFLAYTKGVTYLLMVAILISMVAFWRFLSENDDNDKKDADHGAPKNHH